MTYNSETQADIVFKFLAGKAHTDPNKDIINEQYSASAISTSNDVWLKAINPDPVIAVNNYYAVQVDAKLVLEPTSNGHAYIAVWDTLPTSNSGIDFKTGQTYEYGLGSLTDIASGDVVYAGISDKFGYKYQVNVKDTTGSVISTGDPRNWFYQYNTGIFFQENVIGYAPNRVSLYIYVGSKLSDQVPTVDDRLNIRASVAPTSSNVYAGTTTPVIADYLANYLFLVDFSAANTGAATLNLQGVGAKSIKKYDTATSTFIDVIAGDIQAAPIYYLTYASTGDFFQIYTQAPTTTLSTNFTSAIGTSFALGGLPKGTSFFDVKETDITDSLLYPANRASFSSISLLNALSAPVTTLREVGDGLVPANYIFNWATTNPSDVAANSISIAPGVVSATANSGSVAFNLPATISRTTPGDFIYNLSLTRKSGINVVSPFTASWGHKVYYGITQSATISATQMIGLSSSIHQTTPSTITTGTVSGYRFFAMPQTFTVSNFSVENISLPMAYNEVGSTLYISGKEIIAITNSFAVGVTYSVYRTKNMTTYGGPFNII
jgi:hypothetical protein